MNKKIITAALAAAMLLTFSGCFRKTDGGVGRTEVVSSSETSSAVTTAEQSTPAASTDDVVTTTTPPATEPPVTEPQTTPAPPAPEYPSGLYTREALAALDSTKNGWGQGVNVDSLNRPTGATWAQDKYGNEYGGIYIAPETEGAHLTFDLGYEFGCTGRILDTLKEKGVKGTFFVTMQYVTANPELVRRIIDEGHTLGNHSVNHLSMPTLSIDDMESEVMGLHNYVRDNFGYEMFLFRPPMGEFSVQSLAVVHNLGYKSVFWSFAYYDYDTSNQLDTETAYAKVTSCAHKGAVYLLHGVSETNTAILGRVVDYLRDSGIGIENGWS